MRRPSTMFASAAAAALAALAVTVAAPAIGDERPPDADDVTACLRDHGLEDAPAVPALKPWLGERLDRGDAATQRALDACTPTGLGGSPAAKPELERDLRACLVRHGARIEGTDRAAIKRWVVEHGDTAAAKDAIEACGIGAPPARACGPGERKDAPDTEARPAEPARAAT